VTGGALLLQVSIKPACYLTNLERQKARFWTIEKVAGNTPKSKEEIECEAHFARTVSPDNNYIVRLPFRKTNEFIGKSEQSRLSA